MSELSEERWSNPGLILLVKLGSLLVHASEGMDAEGHVFDYIAFANGLKDFEVVNWIEQGMKLGLLPLRRS